MGRHRIHNGRTEKILIRVNKFEKKAVEDFAKDEGKNISQFIRGLMEEHKTKAKINLHERIFERYESVYEKYRKVLKEYEK
jgi:hypothetical protein